MGNYEATGEALRTYPWLTDPDFRKAVEQVARELAADTGIGPSYFYPKAEAILRLPCFRAAKQK